MAVVLTPQPYGRMLRTLWQFEGWRCAWRPVCSGVLWVVARVLPYVGAVGGVYIGHTLTVPAVAAGAAISVGSWKLGDTLSARRVWRSVVSGRLWTYEQPNPRTTTEVLVGEDRVEHAERELRKARFNPAHRRRLGSPPPDALALCVAIGVEEPAHWLRARSDEDRLERLCAVLARAGVRARVGGRDV